MLANIAEYLKVSVDRVRILSLTENGSITNVKTAVLPDLSGMDNSTIPSNDPT